MCPDLKVTYTLDRDDQQHDSLQDKTVSNGKIWKPQADDYVVDAVKTDQTPGMPPTATVIARTASPVQPVDTSVVRKADTPAAVTITPAKVPDTVVARQDIPRLPDSTQTSRVVTPLPAQAAPIADPVRDDSKVIAETFSKRKEVLARTLDVESDSIRLSFYDNGEIDGDSISVFVNHRVVLTHQELASRALTMYLHLDSTLEVNEISMFAENLGKYPPNTALMVITDGKNRYEVFMSSSLTENATIKIKRKKSP